MRLLDIRHLALTEKLRVTYRRTRSAATCMHSWREGCSKTCEGTLTLSPYLYNGRQQRRSCKRENGPKYAASAIAGYAPIVLLRISMYSCTLRVDVRPSLVCLTWSIRPSKYLRCISLHCCCISSIILAILSWGFLGTGRNSLGSSRCIENRTYPDRIAFWSVH